MCIITCDCCPIIVTSQIYITHLRIGEKLRGGKFGDGELVLEQLMNAPFDYDDCGVIPPHLVSLTKTPKLGASWSITSA